MRTPRAYDADAVAVRAGRAACVSPAKPRAAGHRSARHPASGQAAACRPSAASWRRLRSGVSDPHALGWWWNCGRRCVPQLQPLAALRGLPAAHRVGRGSAGCCRRQRECAVDRPGRALVVSQRAAPQQRARAARAQGAHDIIVAVDAGHGGDDPGATGAVRHPRKRCDAGDRAGAGGAHRSRAGHACGADARRRLFRRSARSHGARAQAAHADMFVSIHADAVRDREVSGASVYILSERGASSEAARDAGRAGERGRPEGRHLAGRQQPGSALGAARSVAERQHRPERRGGRPRARRARSASAPCASAKCSRRPSWCSSRPTFRRCWSRPPTSPIPPRSASCARPAEQQRLADAIFSGIDSYFRKFPPEGSLFARASGATADDDVELARGGSKPRAPQRSVRRGAPVCTLRPLQASRGRACRYAFFLPI